MCLLEVSGTEGWLLCKSMVRYAKQTAWFRHRRKSLLHYFLTVVANGVTSKEKQMVSKGTLSWTTVFYSGPLSYSLNCPEDHPCLPYRLYESLADNTESQRCHSSNWAQFTDSLMTVICSLILKKFQSMFYQLQGTLGRRRLQSQSLYERGGTLALMCVMQPLSKCTLPVWWQCAENLQKGSWEAFEQREKKSMLVHWRTFILNHLECCSCLWPLQSIKLTSQKRLCHCNSSATGIEWNC